MGLAVLECGCPRRRAHHGRSGATRSGARCCQWSGERLQPHPHPRRRVERSKRVCSQGGALSSAREVLCDHRLGGREQRRGRCRRLGRCGKAALGRREHEQHVPAQQRKSAAYAALTRVAALSPPAAICTAAAAASHRHPAVASAQVAAERGATTWVAHIMQPVGVRRHVSREGQFLRGDHSYGRRRGRDTKGASEWCAQQRGRGARRRWWRRHSERHSCRPCGRCFGWGSSHRSRQARRRRRGDFGCVQMAVQVLINLESGHAGGAHRALHEARHRPLRSGTARSETSSL